MESKFLDTYTKRMVKALHKINPSWDKDDIEKIVRREIDSSIQNPSVSLDNNYTHAHNDDSSLLSVLDWTLDTKPITAGNATFYKNQHEAINPIANMLMNILANRKAIKKQMFKIEDYESFEYKDLDRGQKNEKINVNSYYGASGMPGSAFYSTWSGPATTISAQQVISTAENMFEGFIADNYDFIDMNEFTDWFLVVNKNYPDEIDDFIRPVSKEELYDRLSNHIIKFKDNDSYTLREAINSMSDEERSIFYYKNNLIQFIKDHKIVRDLYLSIFEDIKNLDYYDEDTWVDHAKELGVDLDKVKKYKDWEKYVNKEYFMDPNDVPDSIKDNLIKFRDYVMKYVYVPYLSFDRVYRLKNFQRRTVTVIDTDSNILALDTFVNYTINEVLPYPECFGRDKNHNKFIAVNSITYIITEAIKNTLELYAKSSNIPEEFRPALNMKNEFYFSVLIIGKTKKRYLSKVLLREGNYMKKPKTDIKGFDFVKSTTSPESEKFYKHLIDEYIMGDEIDTYGVLNGLKEYRDKITESIKSGDVSYLPITSAKSLSAYKDPGSEQSVRGFLLWNAVYPDDEIETPSKPRLLKINIFKESDLDRIKDKYPEVAEAIRNTVFYDTTGIFRTQTKKVKKGETVIEIKNRGATVLCVPSNRQIPEWAIEYADIPTMIDNILAPFKSVAEILGIQNFEVGKTINGTMRKSETISNVVRF